MTEQDQKNLKEVQEIVRDNPILEENMKKANTPERQTISFKCPYCKSETELFGTDDFNRLWHTCGDRERRHFSECSKHGKHIDPFYVCGCERRIVVEMR